MNQIKNFSGIFFKTISVKDASILGSTFFATLVSALTWIGTISAGIIPIVALAVAIYQFKIQRTRYHKEKLQLEDAEIEHNKIKSDKKT